MKSFFLGALASSLGLCLTSPMFAQSGNLLPTPSFNSPWSGYSASPTYKTARMFEDAPEAIPTPMAEPQAAPAYGDSTYEVPRGPAPAKNSSAVPAMRPHGQPAPAMHSHAAPAHSTYSAPSYSAPTYSSPAYSGPAYSSPAYSSPAYSGATYGSGAAVGGGYVEGSVVEGGAVEGGYVEGGYVEGSGGGFATTGAIDAFMAHRYGGGGCWYGYVNGLVMNRSGDDFEQLSFDTSNPVGQLLSTRDASMDWSGGVEVFAGHRLGNCWAFEVGYWGLFPGREEANAYDPDGTRGTAADLNTVFDLTTLGYDDAGGAGYQNVNNWFDNAARHRLRREFVYHNAEANLVFSPSQFCCGCNPCGCGQSCGQPCGQGCGQACGGCGQAGGVGVGGLGGYGGCGSGIGQRFTVNWLFGLRYMHVGENWEYASDETDTEFTGAANELYYDIKTKNELFGLQFGGNGQYRVTSCLSADFGVKFGLFNNHMTQHSRIYGANGTATVVPGIANQGRAFDIRSTDDQIAFLGEIKAGINYQISCHWSLNAGYRAVAVNGLALPQDQIPRNFADIDGVADINSNGCLFLHGAYGGLEFCY